jgi:hypothetical protein
MIAPVWEVQKKNPEDCEHNHQEIVTREDIDISGNGLRFVMQDEFAICRQCDQELPMSETDTLAVEIEDLEEIPF